MPQQRDGRQSHADRAIPLSLNGILLPRLSFALNIVAPQLFIRKFLSPRHTVRPERKKAANAAFLL
ncbi:hypothetical protein AAD001_12485 [Colwelliaceae bacterium 6471]